MVEVRSGCKLTNSAEALREAVSDRDEHSAEIKPVHHEPGRHAWRKPAGFGHFGRVSAHDDAEDNEHPEHAEREIGQRLGKARPNLAPIKPDDHNSTNTPGAAKTAACSNVRGIVLGPAANWYVPA